MNWYVVVCVSVKDNSFLYNGNWLVNGSYFINCTPLLIVMNNNFSGLLSAFITTSATHPLDVVRINQISMQTNFFSAIKGIASRGNYFGAFYRGYFINTLAYSSSYGLFFPLNK